MKIDIPGKARRNSYGLNTRKEAILVKSHEKTLEPDRQTKQTMQSTSSEKHSPQIMSVNF